MPVDGGSGAGGGSRGGRKGGKKPPLLTLPPVATTTSTTTSSSSGTRSSSSSGASRGSGALGNSGAGAGRSASSSSSSSSSSSYDYAAAQRQRDNAARDRYVTDAEQMQGQIKALRAALGPKGEFKDALKKRLANIELVLGEQMDDLDKAEKARSGSLDADQANNEMAAGDSSVLNETNRVRERASALSEAMTQGAGESDALRTQLMSLRNADANQNEINRAYHDGQRSINNSRIDLALDTHNARVNMVTEAMADKEQLWTTFNNQVSETWTQLGNALGQQAEYYGLAHESATLAGGGGKGKKGSRSSSSSSSSSSSGGKGDRGGRTGVAQAGDGGRGSALGQMNVRPTADSLKDPRDPKGGLYSSGLGGTKLEQGGGGKKYGKGLRGDEARASAQSDRAFMAAAQAQGRAWKNPGLPQELQDWQPPEPEVKQLSNSLLSSARTTIAMKAPEGATLRKW